jgi:hypothetical protein
MIPAWKLRRELYRFAEYAWAGAGLVYEPFVKIFHDRWRRAQPVPPDQQVALQSKVAIFLAYQPRGIAASTLVTLRHLVDHGYAPLVVSNARLSRADRDRLSPVAWRIVERPNRGYDFGGYRDGLLLLEDWGVAVDRILVMNDSIWLPLAPGSTLIARLEAADGDVVGGFMHPDSRRRRSGTQRTGFLESYLYLFNTGALRHPAFQGYWKRFRLSSNKLNAVYRGERGLSRQMRAAGLRVVGLFTPDGLVAALHDAGPGAIRRALSYAVYTEPDLAAEGAALLADPGTDPMWSDDALRHVGKTIARRRFNASFPEPSVGLLGMDFLKKSAGPVGADAASLHSRMRRQYLRAVAAGDLPRPYPEVMAEIAAVEARASGPREATQILR